MRCTPCASPKPRPEPGDRVTIVNAAGVFRIASVDHPWRGAVQVRREGHHYEETFTVAASELRGVPAS